MSFAQMDVLTAGETESYILSAALLLAIVGFLWLFVILHTCVKRIPPSCREMRPWHVWLLFIPCVGCLLGFYVFPNIAKSYQHYFKGQRRTDVGDCGRALSWWVAWTLFLNAFRIPLIRILLIPLSLALFVLFVMEAVRLKKLIPKDAAQTEGTRHPPPKESTEKKKISDEPLLGGIDLDLDSLSSALAGSASGGSSMSPDEIRLDDRDDAGQRGE